MPKTYRIAAIPGDGIGKETVPEGLRVLEAAASRFGFTLETADYDWSCDRYAKTGAMMPTDGLDQLREPRRRLPRRRRLARRPRPRLPLGPPHPHPPRLRPIRLRPPLQASCPEPSTPARQPHRKGHRLLRRPREHRRRVLQPSADASSKAPTASSPASMSVFSRQGTDRILKYAFELAMTRPRRKVTSATKSNGITITMPYWDERFAAMAKQYPGVADRPVPHRHPLRPLRAAPRLVRRRGRIQPVRRYPQRPRPRRRRVESASRQRQHQPRTRPPQHVRAGARIGAGHRGAGGSATLSARSGPAP